MRTDALVDYAEHGVGFIRIEHLECHLRAGVRIIHAVDRNCGSVAVVDICPADSSRRVDSECLVAFKVVKQIVRRVPYKLALTCSACLRHLESERIHAVFVKNGVDSRCLALCGVVLGGKCRKSGLAYRHLVHVAPNLAKRQFAVGAHGSGILVSKRLTLQSHSGAVGLVCRSGCAYGNVERQRHVAVFHSR